MGSVRVGVRVRGGFRVRVRVSAVRFRVRVRVGSGSGLVARGRAGICSPSLSAQAAATGVLAEGAAAAGGRATPPGLVAVTLAETTKSSAPEGWGWGWGWG